MGSYYNTINYYNNRLLDSCDWLLLHQTTLIGLSYKDFGDFPAWVRDFDTKITDGDF